MSYIFDSYLDDRNHGPWRDELDSFYRDDSVTDFGYNDDGWGEYPLYADNSPDTYYPVGEEWCLHRPVESTGECYICDPEHADWEVTDYYENHAHHEAFAERMADLFNEPDEGFNEVWWKDAELSFAIALTLDDQEERESKRARRQQWYGGNARRRQDHGTANTRHRGGGWRDEPPHRSSAKRIAIRDSLALNTITAEFEMNHAEFDEDRLTAQRRQETRVRHTRVTRSSHDESCCY